MKLFLPLCSAIALLMWPALAEASDPSGLVYVLAIVFIGVPFLIGSVVVTIASASERKYASREYAINHIVMSAFFLVVGTFAFLLGALPRADMHDIEEILFSGGALVALPALFVILPWLLHMRQRTDRL